MKLVSETGRSLENPSVFWMFSTTDLEAGAFFCFISWLLILLTDDVSDSEVSFTSIIRFSLRKMGVSCLANKVDCHTDGPAVSGWVGGAAIGTGGLKCCIWVKSGLYLNTSSCFGFCFGIRFLKTRATLLEVEIHERPEEITLTWSVCFRLRFMLLLPKSFLSRSFYRSQFLFDCFLLHLFGFSLKILPQLTISFVSCSELCNVRIPDTNLWLIWFFYDARCGANCSDGAPWGKGLHRARLNYFSVSVPRVVCALSSLVHFVCFLVSVCQYPLTT